MTVAVMHSPVGDTITKKSRAHVPSGGDDSDDQSDSSPILDQLASHFPE